MVWRSEREKFSRDVRPVKLVLAKIRKISFKIIHLTTPLFPTWKACCAAEGLPVKLLPRDVRTRWNSTFDMLDCVLKARVVVEKTTGDKAHGLRACELSDEEWEIAGQLRKSRLVAKHDHHKRHVRPRGRSEARQACVERRYGHPGIAVSTYDLISVKNALDSLFDLQYAGGQLPYAGYPVSLGNTTSFTYHLYALIGVGNVYQWSGDEAYVHEKWPRWKTAMEWAASQIDGTGLANVSAIDANDWARAGMGGHNIAANALLFHTLNVGTALALTQAEPETAERWAGLAAGIQAAAIPLLWQPDVGLFRDNETTTLAPQDGNAWAVKSGLVTDASRIARISEALQARWGEYGPPAPEAVDVVSPFISGFELEVHFAVNRTGAALALIRGMWADFMLDDPRMTNSTFVEGYSTSGALHYGESLPDQRLSFAHGWATGPTSSLTTYVGGIQLLAPAGAVWAIVPQVGDLTHVDAGFSTSLGRFSSTWSMNATAFSITVSSPKGTTGTVGAPVPGNFTSITLLGTGGKGERVQADASGRVWINGVDGGDHEFVLVGL
ncbi:hypothetical protein GSI_12076 [Ganoderma sinense ZZ0214-1]|uniref:Alpha-L-rhamnosidase C-terminal domain-containing protein n=1 Tax=Ganoderma sinense ZZ0214-1 TaxID=1077348 RepID=A0A2G8RXS8_9APHY|nr:hypothetical protein GSI_12076 [Ganoderma sinense ZZ0214-1]